MNAALRFVKMVTFWELLKGLMVTTKYLVKPKITELYPDTRPVLPYRTKGRLHVEIDTCISCRMCEKACPEGCIKVYPPPKEVFKTDKRPAQFYISQEHCLHCGLCVDPCPTGSIHHSQEYELVVYDFDELLFDKETLPYDLDQKRYRWNYLENVVDKRGTKGKRDKGTEGQREKGKKGETGGIGDRGSEIEKQGPESQGAGDSQQAPPP